MKDNCNRSPVDVSGTAKIVLNWKFPLKKSSASRQ